MSENYLDLFRTAFSESDRTPYPYQERIACIPHWPELLDVPTGMGKTAAVTMAWLYKRGWRNGGRNADMDAATPRRLIWCLPMRVLVEQTEQNLRDWLGNLGILGKAGEGKVSVHLLMGGERDLKTWVEHPEEDMVLIGTQDMLLSRALMRGYGMSRYQWPIHFALLHNDCLWAFDEVQLMGAGLTTSAQLEAFRRKFPLAKTSRSIWLSATLKRDWLGTVDLAEQLPGFNTLGLRDADRTQAAERLDAQKVLHRADVSLSSAAKTKEGVKDYVVALSEAILEEHNPDGQTLVILNQVDRAQRLFQEIKKARPEQTDLLIHSRFRAAERGRQSERLSGSHQNRIIVSTQAIEAGVDVSAKTLFTELAPWSSLVQRFGRCNRYGEYKMDNAARVFWIDIEEEAGTLPLPYEGEALQKAREQLMGLVDVAPGKLPPTDEKCPLSAVLRKKDLLDLFNTDPDLSGFDVDVSDYIRDKGIPGLHVFWRDFKGSPNESGARREPESAPHRDELCPVSLGQAKDLSKRKGRAWFWDSLSRQWRSLNPSDAPRSGMSVLLAAADGGYDAALGFIHDGGLAKQPVSVVLREQDDQQQGFGDDRRSRTQIPVLLPDHLAHAAGEAKSLCAVVQENVAADAIIRAARWHDVGKAHKVFQKSMHRCPEAPEGLLAKSNCPGPMRHSRALFRHELASALAWLAQHDDPTQADSQTDLIAYLVAAHHGKVRMSLRAMPDEKQPNDSNSDSSPKALRFARGVWEGDRLSALSFDGEQSREVELKLALMEVGEGEQGRSWTARTLALLDEHGPFRLAWLETLVRLADWRASAKEQETGGYGPCLHATK